MLTTVARVRHRVPRGLAGMLGAGVFTGLAPAASAGGAWLLAGLALAGLLSVGCGLSTSDKLGPLGMLGRVAAAPAVALTFGNYVLPTYPVVAAIGLIA